jgi:glycerol-3-phosphate dehydrogenase
MTATVDIAVIGGGITGLAVARLGARSGFRCTVLERGDLASGTSSASSHMLHGGLRYLEHGRFALIREALAERRAVSRMAPALAAPQRFLVPLYRGDRVGPWRLRAGLTAYDWLAGPHALAPHRVVRAAEARALEPALEPRGLRGAGLYSDVVVDDARLAIAVARDAAAHGADIRTYTEVSGARPAGDGAVELLAADSLTGEVVAVVARAVVVAAGPWTDEVRLRLARALAPGSPDPEPLLRPSRGVHLVYPAVTAGHGLVPVARSDGRVFFVVPFGSHALVGTTEVEVPSPPPASAWRATLEEVRYLRRELARVLPETAHTPPLGLLSGLRPLLRSEQDEVGSASREHRVLEENGVIVVAGGKYTTFRVMARDVIGAVARRLRPGGAPPADGAGPLPPPVAPGAGIERAVEFAVEHEFARRVADVIRRRTRLWLEPDRGRVAAPLVAAAMARRLGWSAERARDEVRYWESLLWEEEALIRQTQEGGAS